MAVLSLLFVVVSLRSPAADVEGGSPHSFALQPLDDGQLAEPTLPKHIAVAADATPTERFAAEELQGFLSKLCPTLKLAVGRPQTDGQPQIAVGRGAALALGAPARALGQANETTLLDSTLLASSGSTIVSGGPDRGALYAAYQLLEHLGYRFLAEDETITPASCPSQLPTFEQHTSTPDFEYRDNNQIAILLKPLWATRVGYNGDTSNQSSAMGGHMGYADPPGFVHTAYNLVAGMKVANQNAHPSTVYNLKPEWFYPRYRGANGQLCWSNDELVLHLTEEVRAALRAQPERRIVSVSQMDNGNYCRDAKEEALAAKHGAKIGPMLVAVNRIADAIKDEFPHAAIDTLAYQWSRAPPTSDLKPRPNVIIRLCAIEGDFAHPLTHPHNAHFLADLRGWKAKSDRIYVWDYNTDFDGYFVPYPNVHTLQANLHTYREHGVRGVFEEGNYNSKGGDLTQLKDYLLAKSLWNSSTDAAATIREFTDGYYGTEGGKAVRTYISLMTQGVDDSYSMPYAFAGERSNVPFMKPNLLLGAANALTDAINATSTRLGASHKYVRRLEETSMPLQYVFLFRWKELQRAQEQAKQQTALGAAPSDAHAQLASRWPFAADIRAQYAEFQRCYKQVGVTKLNEHADARAGADFEWMERMISELRESRAVSSSSVPGGGALPWSNGRSARALAASKAASQQKRNKLFGIFLQMADEVTPRECVSRLGRCYQPPSAELRDERVDA